MALLEVQDLKTYFRTDDGVVKAVDGVSFSIEKGKPTVRLDMLARVLAAVGLALSTAPRDRVWRPGNHER